MVLFPLIHATCILTRFIFGVKAYLMIGLPGAVTALVHQPAAPVFKAKQETVREARAAPVLELVS